MTGTLWVDWGPLPGREGLLEVRAACLTGEEMLRMQAGRELWRSAGRQLSVVMSVEALARATGGTWWLVWQQAVEPLLIASGAEPPPVVWPDPMPDLLSGVHG